MSGPLDGVRVLSCEIQVAGPYCTMMLATVGEVVGALEAVHGSWRDAVVREAQT